MTDLKTEKIGAKGEFESIMSSYLGALADKLDVAFIVICEALSHGVEEIAEVTSHDVRSRGGKKDRSASLGGGKGKSPTTIRRRISYSC